MIEKNNKEKVLEHFFKYPTEGIHLRELSRRIQLSMPAILSITKKLEKEGLITKNKGIALTVLMPNNENKNFLRLKRVYNLKSLYFSGLIDYLIKEYRLPQAIICFGSYSKGEDFEKSDIDIAIISGNEKNTNLEKFERILARKISIHHISLDKISRELKSNIFNGIVLEGAI